MTPEEQLLEEVQKIVDGLLGSLGPLAKMAGFDSRKISKNIVDISSRFVEKKIEQEQLLNERSRFLK